MAVRILTAAAMAVSVLVSAPASAAVRGRYVRIDTMSYAMELSEVEVFREGRNLLRGRPELLTGGGGWLLYGPAPEGRQGRTLTDGKVDPSQRGSIRSPDVETSFAHVEFDLGKAQPLDRVVFHVSRWDNPGIKKWFDDPEGWRIVTVLDENRHVVFCRLVTLYTPQYRAAKGVMAVDLDKPGGPFAGRVIPEGSRGWFSMGEFLVAVLGVEPRPVRRDAGAEARMAAFARRNAPAQLAGLAERLVFELDDASPAAAKVKALAAAGKPAEALDAFKRVFLGRLSYLDTLAPHGQIYRFPADPRSRAMMKARDLLACRTVDREGKAVWQVRPGEVLDFSPSRAPWHQPHPRSLLMAYTATGEAKYLRRWAEIVDERSLFFQRWADGGDRRDYFPLRQMDDINLTLRDLRSAMRARPEFVDDLPAEALVRLLELWLIEAAPAYWRLARKTVFNHQFNIWGGAYVASRMLRDFVVGRRMHREMVDHFQRLWTLAQTRDGSMIEVADIGHVPCPLGTPAYRYYQMKRDEPEWFTPQMEAWFLHQYHTTARYVVRFIAPHGVEHRSGKDLETYCFDKLRMLLLRRRGEAWPRPFLSEYIDARGAEELAGLIVREPEVRAIIDTVYGRGRSPAGMSSDRRRAYEQSLRRLPGGYQGPPETVSDCMPYAGIHFLRRDWSPGASFIEMVCQPPGGSANDRFMDSLGENWYGSVFWDTQFHYWDFGQPLLLSRPLRVDGQMQCQSFETRGWKPGSKTERLVEAPEKPLPNRFHCSPRFDYQECFFHGAYQTWELEYKGEPRRAHLKTGDALVKDCHTTRQIIQLRRRRLFIVVDRVRFSDDDPHAVEARYLMLPTDKDAKVDTEDASPAIRLTRPSGAQLTVRHFGPAGMTYGKLKPAKGRTRLRAAWRARGETVLVSLLEPRRSAAAKATVTAVRPTSAPGEVGFDATTADGARVLFRVPARLGGPGGAPASERATLAVRDAETSWAGLAVGTKSVRLGSREVALGAADVEFGVSAGGEVVETPIRRPIDPPSFTPPTEVFTGAVEVAIASETPGVEIRYTLDGTEPTARSPRYSRPLRVTEDVAIQARAFRPGAETVPFSTAGTEVSEISYARFRKESPRRAVETGATEAGLEWEYMEGRWFRLFGSADRLPAAKSGTTAKLLDVSMRATDGPFAVRYSGYLVVPESGLYTFHGPREYVVNGCEPGYDLRVFVDGQEWRLGQRWHGRGVWTIPLAKGPHRFAVVFADARARDIESQRIDYWRGYPRPWVVWRGEAPTLDVTGPAGRRQPIPDAWLRR